MNDIISSIKTRQDQDLLLKVVEEVNVQIYKTDQNLDKIFSQNSATSIKELKIQLEKDELKNPEEKEKFLSELKEQIKSLKVINLTIAIPADEKTTDLIFSWAGKKLKGNYIFDIEYDPKIIAGAQISYEGKYIDESLVKRIDQILADKKEEILTLSNS